MYDLRPQLHFRRSCRTCDASPQSHRPTMQQAPVFVLELAFAVVFGVQGLVSVAPGVTLDARQQTVLESMPFISGAALAGITLVGGDVKKKANTASGCVRPEVFWDARFSIAGST